MTKATPTRMHDNLRDVLPNIQTPSAPKSTGTLRMERRGERRGEKERIVREEGMGKKRVKIWRREKVWREDERKAGEREEEIL